SNSCEPSHIPNTKTLSTKRKNERQSVRALLTVSPIANPLFRLVLGPRNGSLTDFLPKLTILHSKNNFTLGLVLGDLFNDELSPSEEQLLTGDLKVPFPIYFSIGNRPLPSKILEKVETSNG